MATSDQDFFAEQELLPAHVTFDDVNQEVELLKLLGIERPNRKFVLLKLTSAHPELHFGPGNVEVECGTPAFAEPEYNSEAAQRILDLADQYPAVALDFYDFMSNPSDEQLTRCIRVARRVGLITETAREARQNKHKKSHMPESVTDMVLACLARHGAMTRADIIAEVAPGHIARRPAAAVRTALRRLVSTGQLCQEGDLYYPPHCQPTEA